MKIERRELLSVLTAAAGSALLPKSASGSPEQAVAASGALPKERVAGFGGFFFRARDPKALALWYQEHLGITTVPQNYTDQPWTQEAGPTAFAPFGEKTTYFGDPAKQFMLNFRVHDLDKMAKQLEAAGIEVKTGIGLPPS
jgi:glyoxylase I family protein